LGGKRSGSGREGRGGWKGGIINKIEKRGGKRSSSSLPKSLRLYQKKKKKKAKKKIYRTKKGGEENLPILPLYEIKRPSSPANIGK